MGSEWQGQAVTDLGVLEGARGGAEGPSEFPASGDKIPGFPATQVCLGQNHKLEVTVELLRSHRWIAGMIADPGLSGSQSVLDHWWEAGGGGWGQG